MRASWSSLSVLELVALVIIAAATTACSIWVIDRDPPVVVMDAVASQPAVAPGEVLKVRYEVERYRSCPSKIDRLIVDANQVRFALDDLDFAAAPGPIGRDTYAVNVPIPRAFAQGRAVYRVIARYECNLVHRWFWPVVTMREIAFEVRGPPVPVELPSRTAPAK